MTDGDDRLRTHGRDNKDGHKQSLDAAQAVVTDLIQHAQPRFLLATSVLLEIRAALEKRRSQTDNG